MCLFSAIISRSTLPGNCVSSMPLLPGPLCRELFLFSTITSRSTLPGVVVPLRVPSNKDLFLIKKQTDLEWHLILAQVEKVEIIPDNTAPKSYLPLLAENYYRALSTLGSRRKKISLRARSSLISWKADKYSNRQEVSLEIKLKSNESRWPKFCDFKQRMKIQPENSTEKITLQKSQLKLTEN